MGGTESEECNKHRAALLGNPRYRAALENTWKKSQYGTKDAHEEGGLLGIVVDEGQPYQRENYLNARFTRLAGTPRTKLVGIHEWGYERIKADKGMVSYYYHYHTHPFDEGKYYEGIKAGDPNFPSYPDVDTLSAFERISGGAMKGVLVTPTSVVVFNRQGLQECVFRRPF